MPPIELDLFSNPDIVIDISDQPHPQNRLVKRTLPSVKKPKTEESKAKLAAFSKRDKAASASKQTFLPGLSRRGRPRSKDPISAVERTAQHRRQRLEAGSKRVEVILSPDVAQHLEALAKHYNEPKSEVVTDLIQKAFVKVFKAHATARS